MLFFRYSKNAINLRTKSNLHAYVTGHLLEKIIADMWHITVYLMYFLNVYSSFQGAFIQFFNKDDKNKYYFCNYYY